MTDWLKCFNDMFTNFKSWFFTTTGNLFFKGGLSGLREFLINWIHFKSDKNCFLFYVRSYCCSQDFTLFTGISVIKETGLIGNLRLVSKFMTTLAQHNTHTAQYITKKDNQVGRFAQLIEYHMRNIFLQVSCKK